MINAFFQAAQPFGEDGWLWIEGNDLAHMAIPDGNRNLIYVGPCVENLPNLAEDKKAALLEALGLPSTHVLQPSGGGTYPNLTNQDMIDAMERAASRFGQSGIDWIRRSGLTFITTPATNLGKPYAGPPIKEIPGLADEHKKALRRQVISKIG
jgi:hypothetical protein